MENGGAAVSPSRDATEARGAFLSTYPAGPQDRRLALAAFLLSVAIFAGAAPHAKQPLAAVPAFLPIYQSALVVCDLITAILLFGQFRILHSTALLVLAGGYLFSALMAICHALSFPGLFAPGGLLGSGPQTTAWLYFFWHGGFPAAVIAYALLGDRQIRRGSPGAATASAVVAVVVAAGALMLFATAGHDALPVIMRGDEDFPAKYAVAWGTWLLALAALPVLWRRRPHSVLDLWLMVVICAWLFDVALSSVFNAGRYSGGWYAGRAYGLLASSFVMAVLLLENGRLYARLADAYARHGKRLQILHGIDAAIVGGVSPATIAGAAIQPLREVLDVPRAIVNIFDLPKGEVEWLAAAGRQRTRVGPGVRYPIRLMGDLDALRRGEPQVIDTHALPEGADRDALLASGVEGYAVVPMIAGGELIGAISFGGESKAFPPEQVAIAREVATQMAIAITQARLYDRVRRHADELEEKVRERTAELQTANKELESFSYSVSHDLRAPLRAISGFTQMLEEDYSARLDDEGRRLLGVVRANSQRMGQLIEDLLAFSRLGRQPLATQSVALRDLVHEIIREQQADATGRRIDFAVGELGAARADPALLRQVLTNLLGNAVKFTRKKDAAKIEVGCRIEAGTPNVYYVKDNGAGFDMKYYDKLFGVFQRLHGADEFEGTGVGLAIVQRVIGRHGGRVWAESAPGEGATFHFTLGAAPDDGAGAGRAG